MNQGILFAHCGARKITREELSGLPVPEATRTHQPLAHHAIVETLIESLGFRHIEVVRDEYAVTPDGMKMFGVMDLDMEYSECRFSIGLRNSNDKSMRLALTVGFRVFVCDNMSFAGDFTPVLYKHTRRLDLVEIISIGMDRIQRNFAPLREQINGWQAQQLLDEEAKLLIYQAFVDRELPLPRHLLPKVHEYYFAPTFEAFRPRTYWSLANAFTSAFKGLRPVPQFALTAKLGTFLSRHASTPLRQEAARPEQPADELLAVG
jgi:hypothetical protein